MNSEQIVQMANRIAAFFAAMPDHAEAVDGVAGHIRKFWEPRMREQLGALIAGGDAGALHPLVLEAWERLAVRA
ncbi:formate dehydrogenase subunit delta [Rubrivivax sp. JA1024]|nr:formate dehydrogenase subunit delta [Rubrivivax sp. JA1024]